LKSAERPTKKVRVMKPWMISVVAGIVTSGVGAFASSIYLHRGLTHRALRFHPLADHAFRLMIWLMIAVRRQEWVAVHRKHHAFTDVVGDPHSPVVEGFWRVWFGNFYFYLQDAADPEVVRKWAPDLPSDRWDRLIYNHYLVGVVAGTGFMMWLLGPWVGLGASAVHAVMMIFVIVPLVNALTHWYGEQPNPNTARNIRWLVWFTAGESLHNNHHARPRSASTRMRPGEHDPGWWVIRGLELLGLVTVRREKSVLRKPA
jgi:stearoyl-CoA desaturase (delta-9 desaturase)